MSEELTVTIADYRQLAETSLPAALFGRSFGSSGSGLLATNIKNESGFEDFELRARVLMSIREPSLATSMLGTDIAMPIFLAAVGGQRRYHADGERASARAAAQMGTLMCVSTGSSLSLEDVAEAATGPLWFQVFFMKDRGITESLVRRAEAAGYEAIVVTVDQPGTRTSERDGIDSMRLREPRIAEGISSIHETPFPNLRDADITNTEQLIDTFDSAFGWPDIAWLQELTSLPIVLKGIQTAEDAALSAQHGVAGLIVSNHGGHTLAAARSTIETLPEVMAAVGDAIEVYLDGGVRTGNDILKALALGARAVGIGRPFLWGLAAKGNPGVAEVLEILREDLKLSAFHCGVADMTSVDSRLVATRNSTQMTPTVDALGIAAQLYDRDLLTLDEFKRVKTQLLG